MRENKLTVKALALLLFLWLPFAVQAQSAPSCTPLVESCGPAPIPPDLQQREQQIDRQFQADAPLPLEQQLSAQQQAFEQQQAQFAQQDQARAEQDQANTMWQEQMNQNQGVTSAGVAALGAVDVAGAIIQRHREEQALQEQIDALNKAHQDSITKGQALNQMNAEADDDAAKLQATTQDLEATTEAMNAILAKAPHVTTHKQLAMLNSQMVALHARADADRAEHESALADLDKLQKQLAALNASIP